MTHGNNQKIALIGLGNICFAAHIPFFKKIGAPIEWAIDTNKDALTKIKKIFPDVKTSHKIEDVKNNEITCAVLSTPTGLHHEQVKQLLLKKIHVLCEKPLATNEKEARELVDIAQNNNTILQTGYYRRFQAATQYIKKIIKTSDLGGLKKCLMLGGHVFSSSEVPPSLVNKKLSGGGCTMDFGVHMIDLLYFWFDRISLNEYYDDNFDGVEANALIKLNGATNSYDTPIEVIISRTNNLGYITYLEFEKLTILYNFNSGYGLRLIGQPIKIIEKEYQMTNEVILESPTVFLDYFEKQWKEFTNRINGSNERFSSLDDAVRTTSIVELCYKNKKELKSSWETIINNSNL